MPYPIQKAMLYLDKGIAYICNQRRLFHQRLVLLEMNAGMALERQQIKSDASYVPLVEFNHLFMLLNPSNIHDYDSRDNFYIALDNLSFCLRCIQERGEVEAILVVEEQYNQLKATLFPRTKPRFTLGAYDTDEEYEEEVIALMDKKDVNTDDIKKFVRGAFIAFLKGELNSLDCLEPLLKEKDLRTQNTFLLVEVLLDCVNETLKEKDEKQTRNLSNCSLELGGLLERYLDRESLNEVAIHIRTVEKRVKRHINQKRDDIALNITLQLGFVLHDFSCFEPSAFFKSRVESTHQMLSDTTNKLALTDIPRGKTRLDELNIPYTLKKLIFTYGENTIKAFLLFYEYACSQNAKADEAHRFDVYAFFFKNQYKLGVLLAIYHSEKGIKLLTRKIYHSNNTLLRFLLELEGIDERLLHILAEGFKIQKQAFGEFKDIEPIERNFVLIMRIYKFLSLKLTLENVESFCNALPGLFKQQNIVRFREEMKTYAIDMLLYALDLKRSQLDASHLNEYLSESRLLHILSGYTTMADSIYKALYLKQLQLELTAASLSDFQHNDKQKSSIGQIVARHNKAFSQTLEEKELDSKVATHYSTTRRFIYAPKGAQHGLHHKVFFIYQHLLRIRDNALHIKPDDVRLLKGLEKLIQAITEMEQKLSRYEARVDVFNLLVSKDFSIRTQKIIKSLQGMLSKRGELSDDFVKLAKTVIGAFTDVESVLLEGSVLKCKASDLPYLFKAHMKDKTELDTLGLGDEMACCMASNADSFQSMVLTRVLDSMPIFVITDEIRKKPAALIWLYFAKNSEDNICLVGEYIEVNNRYLAPAMIKMLTHELLTIVSEYYKSVGRLHGFYLGEHFYGVTKGVVDEYPKKDIFLTDMVGGALITKEVAEEEIDFESATERRGFFKRIYQLNNFSFESVIAHEFSEPVLEKEHIPDVTDLDKIIYDLAKEAKAYGLEDLRQIKAHIIQKVGLTLAPYFQENLLIDKGFEILLDEAIKTIQEERAKDRLTSDKKPSDAELLKRFGHQRSTKKEERTDDEKPAHLPKGSSSI